MEICKDNYNAIKSEYSVTGKAVFVNKDIAKFSNKSDIVVENPPFGVKNKHADRTFLEKAMKVAPVIYSLHKSESKEFIHTLARDNNFEVEEEMELLFPLKASMNYHSRKIYRFNVTLFILRKI